MDPLSLTTSVLALLGACTTASRTIAKIRRLKDAPALVHALNNELSDLRVILMDVTDHFENAQSDGPPIPPVESAIFKLCSSTLSQTRDKVQSVEGIIRHRLLKPGKNSDLKIDKTAFVREHDHLIQLQADLRDLRQKMTGLFSHLGMSKISKIEVQVNEIRTNDIPKLMEGQIKIERTLSQVLSLTPAKPDGTFQWSQSPGTGALNNPKMASVEITVSRSTYKGLEMKCGCSCKRTSVYMQTFFGTLFMCYTAAPVLHHGSRSCPHHRAKEVLVSYLFPTWFLRYMLCFETKWSPSRAITYSLTVAHVIPIDHAVYDLIVAEDLDGIKELLLSEQISIEAQSTAPLSGTLLWSAIAAGSNKCTKFFLEMGADFYFEHSPECSPQRAAWDLILSKTWSPEWREELQGLLPPPDLDEFYSFDPIHKAVVGLSKDSVESIIDANEAQIDSRDRFGRTALTWAVWRGDIEATRTLLLHKPDLNIADNFGRVPITYAARRSQACVELLLQADADIQSRDSQQGTLLHHATYRASSGDLQLVKRLVEAGINIDAIDGYGQTALTKTNKLDIAEYLITQGADPSIHDKGGHNALTFAVQLNEHGLLYLYLQERHDHTEKLKYFGTLMHLAAEFGDTKTLEMLSKGGLARRNVGVENEKGLTPIQVALQRKNVDLEWKDAFWSFLKSVDENQPQFVDTGWFEKTKQEPIKTEYAASIDDEEDSKSDGEFVDAVQYQT